MLSRPNKASFGHVGIGYPFHHALLPAGLFRQRGPDTGGFRSRVRPPRPRTTATENGRQAPVRGSCQRPTRSRDGLRENMEEVPPALAAGTQGEEEPFPPCRSRSQEEGAELRDAPRAKAARETYAPSPTGHEWRCLRPRTPPRLLRLLLDRNHRRLATLMGQISRSSIPTGRAPQRARATPRGGREERGGHAASCGTWRFAAALAVLPVLAACVAASIEGSGRADEDASSTPQGSAASVVVDAEQLMLAATRAAEACGDGGVESVRVATEGLPDGVDFVCRDDPGASCTRASAVVLGPLTRAGSGFPSSYGN